MKTNDLLSINLWSSIAVGMIALGLTSMASGAPYSLEEKNFLALGEAAVMIRSEMQSVYSPTSDALPFAGTFNASGWTLSITGSMGGLPVLYSATGIYNAGTQTTNYTSAGTVGTDTWTGNGFSSFFDVFTEIDLEVLFHTADVVKDVGGATKGIPDRENLTAKTYRTENGVKIGEGEYYKTIDGVIVAGPFKQRISAPVGDGRASITIDDAFLTGLVTGSTLTGQLVPEPTGLVYLAIFAATVTGLRVRSRSRHAAGQ